jgi:uncharacterized protein YdaU (DUF1376 family)
VSGLPEPLTPADCDLRDFAFMPFDVRRFRDSDMLASEDSDVVLAAIMLWSAAWHQVPAASLPDDDRMLAQLAGYGRAVKEWRKVRTGALRNFIQCSDGRLYHTTVSEKANEAWQEKLAYRERKAKRTEAAQKAATARWHGDDEGYATSMPTECEPHQTSMRDASATDAQSMNGGMPKGTGTGTGTVKPKPAHSESNPKPEPPREKPPAEITNANDALNYVCREADWHPENDTQRQNSISIINGWLALGCTLQMIVDSIAKARKRDPSPTRSLKRFDSTIRGRRRDQLGGELPATKSGVEALTHGVARTLAAR